MLNDENVSSKKIIIIGILMSLVCFFVSNMVWATSAALLKDIQVQPLPDDKVQVEFIFSRPTAPPKAFSVDTPPSVILDFPSTLNRLPKELNLQKLNIGTIQNMTAIEGEGKTRVVLELKKNTPYETEVHGNRILLTLGGLTSLHSPNIPWGKGKEYVIQAFDFRRGTEGEGRLIFDLSTSQAAVDFKEEKGKIMARFVDACIADRLIRQFDVVDFGTPVRGFNITRNANDVILTMEASGDYEKMAYQMDNQFIIDIRGMTREERALQKTEGKFVGERISLNFQDVEIRAVLQIIADFAGFNLITSDTVKGNITLRLQNVPWDQALDIVLKSKSLGKRSQGNVVMVAPATEIAAREKQELETQLQAENMGQLRSELIQINYAQAEDLAAILKEKSNSLMTSRGNVTVDKRTNTLLVQDIPEKLVEINALIKKLDIVIRQVEISTQIVTADDRCEQALGMRFGGALNPKWGHRRLGMGSTVERARAIGDFAQDGSVPPSDAVIPTGLMSAPPAAGPTVNTTEGLFSDLATSTSTGGIATLGLALARLPNGTLLDLELQALELESKTKTIARPKLVTTDQNKAVVEQGVDIPYQEKTSSGATSITYKKASLRLEVTPHITPDNKIWMDLQITNDTPVALVQDSAIFTNRLETKVLVNNGETIVLGGVLSLLKNRTKAKVPILGDIPFLGAIFRNRHESEERKELLIFITPKIVVPTG